MKIFTKYVCAARWHRGFIFLLFILCAGSPIAQGQTIRYVKKGATGSNNGTSWENAYTELADALLWAQQNAGLWTTTNPLQIWVAKGTYMPMYSPADQNFGVPAARSNSFKMVIHTQLYGGFSGSETSLTQRNWALNKTILSGDLGGNGVDTEKVYQVIVSVNLDKNAVLDGFVVTDGNAESSSTITIGGSGLYRSYGGGMFVLNSNMTVANVIIKDNKASVGGGIVFFMSSPSITNTVLTGNHSSGYSGSAFYTSESSPVLTNVTISGNAAGVGMSINNSSNVQFRNSIIWSNGTGIRTSASQISFAHCLAQGVTTNDSDGNLDGLLNPMFSDAANRDFSLHFSSPAINEGSNSFYGEGLTPDLSGVSRDLAGNERRRGTIDLGAYEFQNLSSINVRYVRPGGVGNGYSWAAPSGDLQSIINESQNGNEVWVGSGEYQPEAGHSFSMKEGVKIYGGFPATGSPAFTDRNYATLTTTLRGNGAGVIRNINNGLTHAAILDGFTVTGGNAGNEDGGGIRNWYASPALYNLKIKGNSARTGGGIDNGYANILLVNSEISGNTAVNVGSGVSNYASTSPTFINVTITGNIGPAEWGAVYNESVQAIFTNSIIYGNSNGTGILDYDGALSNVTYSLVQGRTANADKHNLNGNLTYTDLFVDATHENFALASGSPAIQMGSNAAYPIEPAGAKDLAGAARLTGPAIDLGAYENQDQFRTRYVRQGGTGNGYTWKYAAGNLQRMIDESAIGHEVWVAAGEYQPASGGWFEMKEGVKIFGGFPNSGTPVLSDRNWNLNATILKGNGSHVIRNDANGLTNAAVLDGFTITGGTAQNGGGMVNNATYPMINHCVFKGNSATQWGGGIFNIGAGTTTIANSLFLQNHAQSGGAAFSNISAKPRFINVTMVGNSASENGGALHNYQGAETELVNTIVWGNTQWPASSQLYTAGSGKTKAYFSILQGGAAAIIGDKAVVDVLDQDPYFTDPVNADFSLQVCSPAINIGTADVLTGLPTDLAGNTRMKGAPDAGAYEFQSAQLTGADRLAANGYVTTVQIATGQSYLVKVTDDVCRSVAAITSHGPSPVSGSVTVTTWVDNAVQTYNGTPYVPRHYDITPATGATTATARVTLYFTQSEFTAYNTALGANSLPVAPGDENGKASLRVFQHHGSPKDGQSGPGAYTGGMSTIVPDVSWNFALARWEVSFDVSGFSGFFIGSINSPLPVKLVSFHGKLTDTGSVELKWQVTGQQDIATYEIEYSVDARNFIPIGQVEANLLNQTHYQYQDNLSRPGPMAYYRLRILENDGHFAFSRVISVKLENTNEMAVYPNPAIDWIWIKGATPASETQIINKQGVIIKTVKMQSGTQQLDISGLQAGLYLIRTAEGAVKKFIKE